MTGVLSHPFFLAAAAGHGEQRATIFFAQVLLLIAVGRLLGEWMQRIGQPAVIGQLLAGIILGPSVFGAIWPAGQQAIFPPNSSALPPSSARWTISAAISAKSSSRPRSWMTPSAGRFSRSSAAWRRRGGL